MAGISDIIGNVKGWFQEKMKPQPRPEDEGKTFGQGEVYYDDPNLIRFIQQKADQNGTSYQEELMKFVDEVESSYRDKKAEGGIASIRDFTAGGGVSGPGTGVSDSIPAMLSDGEIVMTADAVKGFGGGSRKQGAQKLYAMMEKAENSARNKRRS